MEDIKRSWARTSDWSIMRWYFKLQEKAHLTYGKRNNDASQEKIQYVLKEDVDRKKIHKNQSHFRQAYHILWFQPMVREALQEVIDWNIEVVYENIEEKVDTTTNNYATSLYRTVKDLPKIDGTLLVNDITREFKW